MRRSLRYLRITVTALSLTACALLVSLWVRSFWYRDICSITTSAGQNHRFGSFRGALVFTSRQVPQPPNSTLWNFNRRAADQVEHVVIINKPDYEALGVSYLIRTGVVLIVVPHGIPVFATAALAALPWVSLLRRFSLRALLIAMTLVAVGLGVIVSTM